LTPVAANPSSLKTSVTEIHYGKILARVREPLDFCVTAAFSRIVGLLTTSEYRGTMVLGWAGKFSLIPVYAHFWWLQEAMTRGEMTRDLRLGEGYWALLNPLSHVEKRHAYMFNAIGDNLDIGIGSTKPPNGARENLPCFLLMQIQATERYRGEGTCIASCLKVLVALMPAEDQPPDRG
jgi:hypothetical protein